eukprot:scaffold8459_cov121-Isochrysis_galbana.AAC.11
MSEGRYNPVSVRAAFMGPVAWVARRMVMVKPGKVVKPGETGSCKPARRWTSGPTAVRGRI